VEATRGAVVVEVHPSDGIGGAVAASRAESASQEPAIRRYLDSLAAGRTGWLAGLRDPMVGRALVVLHDRPTVPWTVERLAKDIGVSRSSLADRFTHIVGQPPMRYLAQWRMQLASRLLADGTTKVSAVALDVGYQSEAAFSRAFKEVVGVPPATWRRRSSGDSESSGGLNEPGSKIVPYTQP
jgi:AraC-like DNA-binding protein